ncbi:HAD family phosphatase [Clostridium carnis]
MKNIVFDIGNVLLNFNPREYLKGKIKEEKVEEVYKEVFQSEEWVMLDRGIIEEKDAIEVLINRSRENKDNIKIAFENWYDILTPIEKTVEILKKLKEEGYNLYYLSNFHLLAFEHVINKYEFFSIFYGGIVSYRENLIKPEKEMYEKILENYNIKANESIFIDDVKENIDGAKDIGFNTILFTSPDKLIEELKKYNIFI